MNTAEGIVLPKKNVANWNVDGECPAKIYEEKLVLIPSKSINNKTFGNSALSIFLKKKRIIYLLTEELFKSRAMLIETLIEDVNLTFTKKFEFENRDVSIVIALFGNFGLSRFGR